jgi:hypothetical protein
MCDYQERDSKTDFANSSLPRSISFFGPLPRGLTDIILTFFEKGRLFSLVTSVVLDRTSAPRTEPGESS